MKITRRKSIEMMAAATGSMLLSCTNLIAQSSLTEGHGATQAEPHFETLRDAYAVKPVFTWLRLGDIKPTGWLKEQMIRDLRVGSAGSLDKLCSEASSDVFGTGQITPASMHTVNGDDINRSHPWWPGETEGMRKADEFVRHVLSFQDSDGYMGMFSKELRYGREGDLWTQTCLLRGLLSYAELTRNPQVFKAVVRCIDGILEAYDSGNTEFDWGQSHDLMITDVLERLYDLTGDKRYPEFGMCCYETWSAGAKNNRLPGDDDVSLPALLDPMHPYYGHCVHTAEHIRVPLWLWMATGKKDYETAAHNAVDRLGRYSFPSGSIMSSGRPAVLPAPEFINNEPPDPSRGEYEYCTSKEIEVDFESALQKMGRGDHAERVERVFFNALQGSRLQDGSALTYLTPENRFRCDGKTVDGTKLERRNKFSPTQADVAVCCNPSAANVVPFYVRGMWMRHRDGGLAALLYGPCKVSTRIDNVPIELEETTSYPFEHRIEITVRPKSSIEFSFYFRNPEWSSSSAVRCAGAHVSREGEYWRVTKHWSSGDKVQLEFTPEIRQIAACNDEVALQYGALLFAQPIQASATAIKHYPVPGFQDTYYEPASEQEAHLAFQSKTDARNFGFVPVSEKTTRPVSRPFDDPVIRLRGTMLNVSTGEKIV